MNSIIKKQFIHVVAMTQSERGTRYMKAPTDQTVAAWAAAFAVHKPSKPRPGLPARTLEKRTLLCVSYILSRAGIEKPWSSAQRRFAPSAALPAFQDASKKVR